MAGAATARADAGRTRRAPAGGTDPGEAEPGLTDGRAADTARRSPPPEPGRWGSRTFGSLRNRNYRLFASGQAISNTGSWMQRVAQDWLVLELTHNSGSALGVTTGLQFAPMLLSMWGGVIADRYPKRQILIVTQTLMGLLALTLGMLTLTGAVRIWHVYLLAFALGLVTAVDNPTRQAFAVEMVGRDGVANAIALNSAVFNLARIVGPAVAGLVIGLVGTPTAFLLNSASYGAVIIGLKLMRPEELHSAPRSRAARGPGQLRETLAYVRARPRLWLTMILIFFVSTFGMNFQVTNSLMSRAVFHTGASAFGLASTMFAVGALGGALLAARRSHPTLPLLLVTSFAFGLMEITTGLMPTFWTFLFALAPTGVAMLTFNTTANSSTQLATAGDMRGRVMGMYMLVFLGGAPIGSPLAGWLAGEFSPRMSLYAGGVISLAATVAVTIMLARWRGVQVRDYLRPAELARLVS